VSKDREFKRLVREIESLAAAELRLQPGSTRSWLPWRRFPPELDPARIGHEAAPGIMLWPSAGECDPGTAVSKVGGYPNALSSEEWPRVEVPPDRQPRGPAPMSFLAQVELAPLRGLHPLADHLPGSGALLFFLDEFHSAEGLNGDPYRRPCRVVHVDGLDRVDGVRPPPLESRSDWSHHEIATGYYGLKPGFSADCYPAASLRPTHGVTWRQPGFSDMEGLPYRLSEVATRAAARVLGVESAMGAFPHMMFGVPAAHMSRIDNLGHYPGILDYVPGAVPDPRLDYVPPPDDPWVVLLQLSSVLIDLRSGGRQWQMQWMDVGYLGFFIRRSALAARDWSAVVAVIDG
jgi:hypothetical protein